MRSSKGRPWHCTDCTKRESAEIFVCEFIQFSSLFYFSKYYQLGMLVKIFRYVYLIMFLKFFFLFFFDQAYPKVNPSPLAKICMTVAKLHDRSYTLQKKRLNWFEVHSSHTQSEYYSWRAELISISNCLILNAACASVTIGSALLNKLFGCFIKSKSLAIDRRQKDNALCGCQSRRWGEKKVNRNPKRLFTHAYCIPQRS